MDQANKNFGTQGAKRQSLLKNPRPILAQIIEEMSSPNREKGLRLFRTKIYEDPMPYLDAFLEYWYHNHFTLMTKKKNKSSLVSKQIMRDVTAEVRENLSLGMLMPNGKPLRQCTGQECVIMGRRFGGFLKKIGESVGPDERIGSVYRSDSQIKKFWDEK